MTAPATIHASAVLVGAHALLIRGPSGAGKSRLAWDLITAGAIGSLSLPFVRLVADDRVHLERHGGRLLARPAPTLAGLIEIHGIGIRRLPYEPSAIVGFVVDLAAGDAARLPPEAARNAIVEDVRLPRLPVAPDLPALPAVLALLTSVDAKQ
jgi:serine kinase of HPr protein (carbohydrate metabolism regulator)